MGRYGNRGAAAQMDRDGIRTLPRWSKPKRGLGCSIRHRLDHGGCDHADCSKDARYGTPLGNRCYEHAILLSSSLVKNEEAGLPVRSALSTTP